MKMRAYKKTYLNNAADKFGKMMDYAVNDCELDGDAFLHMFISSGLAREFEAGNRKVIAGMSGIELAAQAILLTTGSPPAVIPACIDCQSAQYWAGWALSKYQWYTARRFSTIIRFLPFSDIVAMYDAVHELDIGEFFKAANDAIARKCPQTGLGRIRNEAGLSQAQLAREAEVPLSSIQMYEQRRKDIGRAQVVTLVKIARVLGCSIEDLLEYSYPVSTAAPLARMQK